ncbi:MAG: hypothetical protein CVV12_09995 [Gammaproteobacteria bacterium HGW-Gammaproteobacteria-2]|nr:MAG: hypothetical protein CVV12_09995 [Gammaproteobacteria bacterium HGW-Gammaproteobacteria-2]
MLKRPLSVLRTSPRSGMASLPAAHATATTITAHATNASKYDELRNGSLLRESTADVPAMPSLMPVSYQGRNDNRQKKSRG